MDRVLAERDLTTREGAFWALVRATHDEDARESLVRRAATELTADEVYHATSVIALFNFYNKFVDLNGVNELSPEGYEASGVRLSRQGYAPPP